MSTPASPQLQNRRLAAVVFTDVVGYSARMQRDEASTIALVETDFARMRALCLEHGGEVLNAMGDGLLLCFQSALKAVSFALSVQGEFGTRAVALPSDQALEHRVGVHLGDVVYLNDGSVAGDGVNIAARLESKAPPGGICISQMVYDTVKGKVAMQATFIGPEKLKNIDEPVPVWHVLPEGVKPVPIKPASANKPALTLRLLQHKTASAAVLMAAVLLGLGGYWGLQQYGKVAVNPLSIAVLPFANLSGDAGQAYVADGMTSRVTSDLGRIQDAVVTDAGRVLPYKDKTAIVQQVAKELGVRFVLQGDVQRSADKILINAKLTDANSNKQLWSDRFEGELSDLFALQDKVTHRISGSLGPQMLIIAARESETRMTNPQASDLVLRARALIPKGTALAPLKQRETLLRQALALEPNNIEAMAGLSRALVYLAQQWPEPSEREKVFLEGRDLALKVKEIDPKDKDIYVSLYQFAIRHDDLAGAIENAEKILSLNPKDKTGYITLASALIPSGDSKKAIEVLNKGISLDPLNLHPNNFWIMGSAHLVLGDIDTAITWSLKASQVTPNDRSAWVRLAVAYAMKGESEKAAAAVAEVLKLNPKFKLSDFGSFKPMSASPPAYKEWYEKKFLPACRKAGLPE